MARNGVAVDGVMGVLDHGDAQAILEQMRDHARQQGGLAGAAPSREANHFHRILRNQHLFPSLRGVFATKQSILFPRGGMDCFASLRSAMTAVAAFRPYSDMVYIGWEPLSC